MFTITVSGQMATAISWNIDANELQAALESLPPMGNPPYWFGRE